jgi:hypothetical protein
VKDADTLCAYTKCLEELSVGNREFEPARKRLEQMLDARMNPAMRYSSMSSWEFRLDELMPIDAINGTGHHLLLRIAPITATSGVSPQKSDNKRAPQGLYHIHGHQCPSSRDGTRPLARQAG